MRFYQIALFLTITYAFAGLVAAHSSSFGIQSTIYSDRLDSETISRTEAMKTELKPNATIQQTDPLSGALGWFYQQIGAAADALFSAAFPLVKYVAWLPFYMIWIGIPEEISYAFFGILVIIEVIGFYEFFTGRDIER